MNIVDVNHQQQSYGICQLFCLPKVADPVSIPQMIFQKRKRILRIMKRRHIYLKNLVSEVFRANARSMVSDSEAPAVQRLQPGDVVRVRSRDEIASTLDRWNQLRGCAFMEEMWDYCGTTQRVLKRVERFLDERDYLMKKCSGLVILDGVMCEGTKDYGRCDRMCFFFWREEWLEKVA